MSMQNLLCHTPKQNRTNKDRFLSPLRNSSPRFCLSPERSPRHSPALSPKSCQIGLSEFENSPRSSICGFNGQDGSQDIFSPSRRQRLSSIDPPEPGSPSTPKRSLPAKPQRTIEFEDMLSDFYLSPLDWSSKNYLAFALKFNVTFINPKTLEMVCPPRMPDEINSLKFNQSGSDLCLGCASGTVGFYDTSINCCVSNQKVFNECALVEDWVESSVIAGSKLGEIAVIDSRAQEAQVKPFSIHSEEVCSIKIQRDTSRFATSSDDCTVKIWDLRSIEKGPTMTYDKHEAAIKALSWSPFAKDIIVSGGGTNDKTLRMWNAATGETIKTIDTGSQVCNLYWNEDYNEIISSHGFSQNHMALWKGTDLSPISSSFAHKGRILFMCASPDGSNIAAASPSDGLYIWKVFPPKTIPLSQSLLLLR